MKKKEQRELERRQKLVGDAIRAAGGPAQVGRRFDISSQAVSDWIAKGYVPSRRAIVVRQMAGSDYTLHQLCPDAFPKGVEI